MKQSDDQKLDEMLYNIYNSKATRVFYFSADKDTENDKVFKSHAEHSRRKYFSHSRICAIAAAFLVTVGIGTIFFDDLSSSRTPASVSEISEAATPDKSDYPLRAAYDEYNADTDTDEKSLFEQYLEEFEYEMENFNYQVLKIVPFTADTLDNDNEMYKMLCDMNIIPQHDSLWTYTDENGNNIIYSDSESEFYLCIKCDDFITRQSYLVWTDENGDISKIIPSSEKFSDEDINNSENIEINVNAENIIDEKVNRVSEIMNNIVNYSNEDIKNSIDYSFLLSLTASVNQGAENAEYPDIYNIENFYVNEYFFYCISDGKIIPVMCVCSEYSVYTEKYHESLFFDCSGDTPVYITEQISDKNKNYWLDMAVSSYDSSSEVCEESIDSYTFSSLSFMKSDDLKTFTELCGENALESVDMGYNLYSCYLENYVRIADGIDFDMSPSEIYNAVDTEEKFAVGLNNQETVFFTGESNPDEELEEIYDICFRDSNAGYSILIHFPVPDAESDDERLNSPWAEIRFH